MALPTSYLTSTKTLAAILNAIKAAQAPKTFTNNFLVSLDFKSPSDRLVIGVLKSVGLLDSRGVPSQQYYEFLDQTRSGAVLAAGIREAYADLFQLNNHAEQMSASEVRNKFKTLTQGKLSPSVLNKMVMTFKALCATAEFGGLAVAADQAPKKEKEEPLGTDGDKGKGAGAPSEIKRPVALGGLVYNIQLVLPESRDQAVYDAFFRSLREHLL